MLRSQILLDPGFGFGKTVQHNLDLMLGMERFCALGHGVVWGPSRKSTLGALVGGRPSCRAWLFAPSAAVVAIGTCSTPEDPGTGQKFSRGGQMGKMSGELPVRIAVQRGATHSRDVVHRHRNPRLA